MRQPEVALAGQSAHAWCLQEAFVLDHTRGGRRRTDTPGRPSSNFTSVGAKATATLDLALPTGAQRQPNSFALTAARRHLPYAPPQPRLPRAGAGFGFDETPSACAIAP